MVQLHLPLIKHHAMKTYEPVGIWLQAFVISALDGVE
jgi:hypothetical protein